VAAGASLRQAAHFVDCDPKTIRREARRNDDFADEIGQWSPKRFTQNENRGDCPNFSAGTIRSGWSTRKNGTVPLLRTLTNTQRRILSHPRGLIPSQVSAAPFANMKWTNDLPIRHDVKAARIRPH
jgi:hypothetical protein